MRKKIARAIQTASRSATLCGSASTTRGRSDADTGETLGAGDGSEAPWEPETSCDMRSPQMRS